MVIPYKNILFKDKMGEGANGSVYEGIYENNRYAFKRVSAHRVRTKYIEKFMKKVTNNTMIVLIQSMKLYIYILKNLYLWN